MRESVPRHYLCIVLVCPAYLDTWTGERVVPCWNDGEFPNHKIKATTCERWGDKHKFMKQVDQDKLRKYMLGVEGEWRFPTGYTPLKLDSNYITGRDGVSVWTDKLPRISDCEYYDHWEQISRSSGKKHFRFQITFVPTARCRSKYSAAGGRNLFIAEYWAEQALQQRTDDSKLGCWDMCHQVTSAYALDMDCVIMSAEVNFKESERLMTCKKYIDHQANKRHDKKAHRVYKYEAAYRNGIWGLSEPNEVDRGVAPLYRDLLPGHEE